MKILQIMTIALASAAIFSPREVRAENESWYFNLALGYGIPEYPRALKDAVKTLEKAGASHLPLAIELGFYWPVSTGNLILGGAINGVGDGYSVGGESITISNTGFYFSSIYTFKAEPGDGFFVRGDIGLPRIGVSSSVYNGSSDVGIGALVGGGYGIALGGTRLLFTLTQSISRVESRSYGSTAFTFGGLF